jgi:hypothetical protein
MPLDPMSLEPMPLHATHCNCPRCGAASTRPAPESADEAAIARFQLRIRALTSAAWEQGQAVRGPDGTLLWTGVLVWVGSLAYAWTTSSTSLSFAPWLLLLGVLVLGGTWADRRAARARGWIDPMRRADEIARDVLAREAAARDQASGSDGARVCLQCGHRFEVTDAGAPSPA